MSELLDGRQASNRGNRQGANTGSRSTYQHNLVFVFCGGDFARVNIKKGIDRHRGMVADIFIKIRQHQAVAVSHDSECANGYSLTRRDLDVFRAQIQTFSRSHHCK